MSPSTLSRAAAAAVVLASTACAVYVPGGNNVAIYWGQGAYQRDLSVICDDPSVDIVNLGFVNAFPKQVGDYPGTNFGNACGDAVFKHPTNQADNNKLFSYCPGIAPGIQKCQANGKKVLLSLGGGYPTDYYLANEDVAKYFAEFLTGAFGPKSQSWTGPRPFGDVSVDGYDLDLEATTDAVPNNDAIFANYGYLVNQLKALQNNCLISAAPQCEVPDIRLADAIKTAPFDMIFTQFYNTEACSARKGFSEINMATTDGAFTFGKWADWLNKNSLNKNVKLYMGLPAGVNGAPSYPKHYLKPREANALVSKWKKAYPTVFGGIMAWEATVSQNNTDSGESYSTWMKTIVDGTFESKYQKPKPSSSSVRPSSTKASSSLASSTKASSTPVSSSKASSTPASSSKASSTPVSSSKASSTPASSSKAASSTAASSSAVVSSSIESSSVIASSTIASTTSSAATPTATISSPDGSCGVKGSVIYTCEGYNFGNCCSSYGFCGGEPSAPAGREAYCGADCNPLFGKCDTVSSSSAVSQSASASVSASVSASASSASHVVSSSASVASSVAVSSSASVAASSSASVVASSSASVVASSSASVVASSSAAASTPVVSSSASHSVESSSVYIASSASAPFPSGNATYGAYPTGSASAPTVVYPQGTSKQASPSASASTSCTSSTLSSSYVVPASSASTSCTSSTLSSSHVVPASSASTPCTSSSAVPVHGASSSSSASVYKAASSSAPVYVAHASSSAPVYKAASSSAPVHGAASSSAKVYSAAQPSVTSAPVNNYPSSPASSAVTVVTTTYVDSCETGVTTKTETITKTVCNKCEDSVTSVYVCNNCGPAVVTYTLTKPATPATNVPSVPTYVASVAKPAETPVYSANTPVYSADKPAYTPVHGAANTPVYSAEKPAYTPVYGAANTPVYSATKPSSTPVYDMPKKQEVPGVSTTVAIVYMTPVPVAPSAVPYPSAAQNGTGAYPVKPSGTGVASKPSAYSPPAEFTGAASRVGAGAAGLIAVVAGLLVL